MAKSIGLENIEYFPIKDIKQLAQYHVSIFNIRVKKGVDARGRYFPNYSSDYEYLKSRGMKGKRGKKLKPYRQISIRSRQTRPPDFTLTGRTMVNLRERKHGKDFYVIGWDGEAAEIVQGNQGKGRDIASDIPEKEMKFMLNALNRVIQKEWNKKIKSVKVRAR